MSKKRCSRCTKEKNLIDYYKSYSPIDSDERVRICKSCIHEMVNTEDINTVYDMLRMLDKPFMFHLWDSALTKSNSIIGEYFKLINAKDYKHMTWQNSIFSENETQNTPVNHNAVNEASKFEIDEIFLEELKEKYGYGYPDEEYILFEKRFQKLKPSFQLPTTMHEEYLREYCVNKVKESLAKAKGDFKEAKEWSSMAKESATGGKLTPQQMSKSDLSQGLDGFSQLSRMVEEQVDIIPLLPKFLKQPKDDVDVTLWMYINYIRDLKSLAPAKYEDIYKFYDERVKDYESQKLDLESDGAVDGEL